MSSTETESLSGADSDEELRRDLTAFQQTILIKLTDEPKYGLAIKRELEDYYGEEVNHGRLYPNLDNLVEMGLIEKSQLDKRTNQYALTERGFDAVVDRFELTLEYAMDGANAQEFQQVIEQYCD